MEAFRPRVGLVLAVILFGAAAGYLIGHVFITPLLDPHPGHPEWRKYLDNAIIGAARLASALAGAGVAFGLFVWFVRRQQP